MIGELAPTEAPDGYARMLRDMQVRIEELERRTVLHRPHRNMLTNGALDVWQRGDGTFLGTGYNYTADQWLFVRSGFAAGTTAGRVVNPLNGFTSWIRLSRTAGNASTAFYLLEQTLESTNAVRAAGRTVTFSFGAIKYANWSPANGGVQVVALSGTGADTGAAVKGLFTSPTIIVNRSVPLASGSGRYYVTFDVPANCRQLAIRIEAYPTGTAGALDIIDVTGLQLEIGPLATPFEYRPIQQEISLCRRWYRRFGPGSIYDVWGMGVSAASATACKIFIPLAPAMRTIPVAAGNSGALRVVGANNNGGSITSYSVLPNESSVNLVALGVAHNSTGVTQEPRYMSAENDVNAYISFSSEF